jgi:hypothetical protein
MAGEISGRLSFIEQGKQAGLVLTSEGPVSPVLKMDLRQIVKEKLGADTKVLIYVLLSSPIEQGQEKDRG